MTDDDIHDLGRDFDAVLFHRFGILLGTSSLSLRRKAGNQRERSGAHQDISESSKWHIQYLYLLFTGEITFLNLLQTDM